MQAAVQKKSVTLLAAFVSAITFANVLPAQEPPRWKLQAGDTVGYRIVEEMTLDASGGPTEPSTVTVRQEMNLAWTVESVAKSGDALIRQKVDDVKFTLSRPNGERIEYDSRGQEETASLAAMVGPIYDAMTAEEFTFTMDNRGTITDVKVPDKVIQALKNSPRAAVPAEMATPEGLQRMIMKWALVLPEKMPAEGDEWSASAELDSPNGGKKRIKSTYVYKGTKEVDGKKYAVFQPGLELTIGNTDQARTKVVEQDSSGEILFDHAAGRIYSATIERSVTIDVTVEGHTERQNIAQTIEVQETKKN